jgi:hypothetical protein
LWIFYIQLDLFLCDSWVNTVWMLWVCVSLTNGCQFRIGSACVSTYCCLKPWQRTDLCWTLLKSVTKNSPNTTWQHVGQGSRRNNRRIHLVILINCTLFLNRLCPLWAQKFVHSAAIEEDILGAWNVNTAVVVRSNSIKPGSDFWTPACKKCIVLGVYLSTCTSSQRVVTPIRVEVV